MAPEAQELRGTGNTEMTANDGQGNSPDNDPESALQNLMGSKSARCEFCQSGVAGFHDAVFGQQARKAG